MDQDLLVVKNLSVSFGSEVVLKNLSFSIKRKDVLIVVGPNGAGKTTLIRSLLNLVPYTGSVSWITQNVGYLPPQETLQRRGLPPLSVKDFFSFKSNDEEKMIKLLNDVGLDNSFLNKQFGVLSTGQFQRMLIAWSLLNDPEVLLFDEPISGIDIGGEETIYSLLHKFWKERILTIILVSHDLDIVWEHANIVLCLNKTKVCMGHPEQVLTPENLKKIYGVNIKFYRHDHDSR